MGLYNEVWRHDCYRLCQPPLRPGGTIVDIGAKVGMFAPYVAREFSPQRVYCSEPSPMAVADLQQNVYANGFGDTIRIFQSLWRRATGRNSCWSPRRQR